MNGNVELSMFVGGDKQVSEETVPLNRVFFARAQSYFLWAALGVMGALTIFSTSTQHVKHLVAFRYKPDATPAQIAEVSQAFQSLTSVIPGIISFEHGDNIDLAQSTDKFNHIYVLTFENSSARDAFLPHPAHEKFEHLLTQQDLIEDVLVLDYHTR